MHSYQETVKHLQTGSATHISWQAMTGGFHGGLRDRSQLKAVDVLTLGTCIDQLKIEWQNLGKRAQYSLNLPEMSGWHAAVCLAPICSAMMLNAGSSDYTSQMHVRLSLCELVSVLMHAMSTGTWPHSNGCMQSYSLIAHVHLQVARGSQHMLGGWCWTPRRASMTATCCFLISTPCTRPSSRYGSFGAQTTQASLFGELATVRERPASLPALKTFTLPVISNDHLTACPLHPSMFTLGCSPSLRLALGRNYSTKVS